MTCLFWTPENTAYGAESGAALIRSTMLSVFVIKLFAFLSRSVFMFERELLISDCDYVMSARMHLFWFAWAVIRSSNCCNLLFMFVESWEISYGTLTDNLPYPFQNPISNFYLSLEAGKSSTDSVILRKLTNVEIIFRAWTKSLKRTKLYFDD